MSNYKKGDGVSSHGLKTDGFPHREFYEADEAIENIKKMKSGTGKVGRISYYYESIKGMYFYMHKIIKGDSSYVDTVRYYCATASETMYEECRKSDTLI